MSEYSKLNQDSKFLTLLKSRMYSEKDKNVINSYFQYSSNIENENRIKLQNQILFLNEIYPKIENSNDKQIIATYLVEFARKVAHICYEDKNNKRSYYFYIAIVVTHKQLKNNDLTIEIINEAMNLQTKFNDNQLQTILNIKETISKH